MSIENLDCLKRKQDICVKTIITSHVDPPLKVTSLSSERRWNTGSQA